jgi:CO/xanthine dehydrogenase FAD-binding subunit
MEMARRHGDFALAGVACTLTLDEAGTCNEARIALFGVGDGPVLSTAAAAALKGTKPGDDAFRAAATAVEAEIDPPSDIHASADYRRSLSNVLTRRALTIAAERAGVAA